MAETRTRRRTPKGPQPLKSFNPRTGEIMGEIPSTDPAEVANIVEQASKVAPEWAAIPIEGRVRMLGEVRNRVYELIDDIVETVAAECGKPRFEALAHDVVPVIMLLHSLEKIAPKALRDKKLGFFYPPVIAKLLAGTSSRIEWRPFGVVGAITPWNYPMTNCFLAFAPALFAGNTVVIKPSEVTPACGELVRQVLDPLPAGVASIIQGGGDVGAALVDAPCDKISFIGSPLTGRRITEAAAKHLTPVVMELGGTDAAIVCEDADIDLTAAGIVWGSFFNAGQTCCSIERIYVVDSIADRFEQEVISKLDRVRQGDEVGSITFQPQFDKVQEHVNEAVDKGARLLAGGPDAGLKNQNGSLWYAPTILTDVTEEMQVQSTETFGPVVTIVRVRDEAEALRRANEESVNLTASVWTKNKHKAREIASQLRAGGITINQHGEGASAGWAAWGGVGESGFGRLNGELGLREFTVPTVIGESTLPLKRMWWFPYDSASEEMLRATAQAFGATSRGQRISGLVTAMKNARAALKNKL